MTHRHTSRGGFTLVESSISVLIVGMLIVASLRSLTSSFQSNQFSQNRVRATLLAEQLLVELSLLPWRDPDSPGTADTIGRDTGDPSTVTRRNQLDDVDDFDDWTESPPADVTGTALVGVSSSLQRTVLVENTSSTDPATTVADNVNSGLRRLTVIVTDSSSELARIVVLISKADSALRTSADQQRSVPNVSDP